MARERITGAWARRSTPTLAVPLKPQPDPEHLDPTPNVDVTVGMPLWIESSAAPTLPPEIATDGMAVPIGGGGPIDHTPEDPQYGPGAGHGQTTGEAQAVRTHWMSRDDGAVASRLWQPMTDRDGAPHLAIIPDVELDGDSPQTLQYQRTGLGQPIDPHARRGQRQKRWWDRVIDMHRYGVMFRPMPMRYAQPVPTQPPGGNTQYDSPWTTNAPQRATPDAFVATQVRRTPTDWATPITGDGTAMQLVGDVGGFGLGQWGL